MDSEPFDIVGREFSDAPDEFQVFWGRSFPDCPPITHELKWRLPDRWLRIHSLPGSKRYAENSVERDEILRRQCSVLSDLIGENEDCFLVWAVYDSADVTTRNDSGKLAELLTEESSAVPLQRFDEESEAGEVYRVYFKRSDLRLGLLDEILVQIANDEESGFFILSTKTPRIFAPYDGGVDLIFESSEVRNAYREKYAGWLSTHESGL